MITQPHGSVTIHDDVASWAAVFADAPSIAVDTETTGLELFGRVRTIQVGTPDGRVAILDCRNLDAVPRTHFIPQVPTWRIPQVEPWGFQIRDAFKDKEILMHNAGFDLARLTTMFGVEILPPGEQHRLYDTMIVERILHTGLLWANHDLGAVVRRRTGIKIPKGLATAFAHHAGPWRNDLIRYMADDVRYLHAIRDAQQLPLSVLKLHKTAEIDMGCLPAIARMEVRGFHLSDTLWKVCRDTAYETAHELEHALAALITPYLPGTQQTLFGNASPTVIKKLGSPAQLLDLFHTMYPHVPVPNTKKLTLELLGDEVPLAQTLLEYRKHIKFARDFGDALLVHRDMFGMIHPTVDPIKKTGRMGFRNPNLQNIPRGDKSSRVREAFTAPFGYMVVVADYSQMELRTLAEISGDVVMQQVYRDDVDLHTFTAHRVFGVPMEDVTKEQRDMAKTTNFSIVYGIQARNLARQLSAKVKREVSPDEAQQLIDGFMQLYPQAAAWLEAQHRLVWTSRMCRTPLGRLRWLDVPAQSDPDFLKKMGRLEREAANMPVQGANADATKLALSWLYTALEPYGAWVCNIVHDEIVVYSPEAHAAEVETLVSTTMVAAATTFIRNVPIQADPKTATSWKK